VSETPNELSGSAPFVVDASVHVFFQGNDEIREWMEEPFRSRGFPHVEMDWYGAPDGEYDPAIAEATEGYPGADPRQVGRHLFEERGIDIAILHPMTRGIMPDRHLGSALLAAHNDLLAKRWLDDEVYGERFRGTIRVNPDDVEGALKEIDRWADHPRMVQIGVPMQSREVYGKPQFWPLWLEAEQRGLPVAVHIETGNGVMNPPTPSGHPRTYPHYTTFMGLNYLYHLMNMIAEGVFESMPKLKFVWADGGAEMLTPFSWRMDTFGRPHLEQTPWAPSIPSSYLAEHVFFVQSTLDGVGRDGIAAEWLEFTGKSDMVMYGSSYPHWSINETSSLSPDLTDEQRQKLLWKNADNLYGLGLAAAVPVPA
jgi:predicted TIM-barrel fold metal-dependent hydrolase